MPTLSQAATSITPDPSQVIPSSAYRFALLCKSYRNDVLRVKRLLASVVQHNVEKIPFYLSTPLVDRQLFIDTLGTQGYIWVSDEEIAATNVRSGTAWLAKTHGYISQQIIKSEFWRLGMCDSYLCLDSDALFIRSFGLSDFVHPSGDAYSIVHGCEELLTEADKRGFYEVRRNFLADSEMLKSEFGRIGADYDYGPPPMLWSAKVWRWLDEVYLQPRGETLVDAITRKPSEIRWYGEALLISGCMPIYEINPLFRFYHFEWQYKMDIDMGVTLDDLRRQYLGVVYQSNWDFATDAPFAKKSTGSRMWLGIKQKIKALRFSKVYQ